MARSIRLRPTLLVAALAWLAAVVPAGSSLLPTGPATRAGATADDEAALANLAEDLDRILDDPRLEQATVGVVVREAESGTVLYERSGGRRLLPASNAKLLVAAAALDVLGPDHRFETAVLADGPRQAGAVRGSLHLRGGGDPTMLPADYDALAGQVAAAGVTTVEGDLIVDDTWFDEVRLGSDWSWDDEEQAYAAPVSGLTLSPDGDLDAGTVAVDVAPGEAPGRPAVARLVPASDHVVLRNEALTGEPTGGGRPGPPGLALQRGHGTNELTLSGSVPADAPGRRLWSSVWDPTGQAAAVFRDALARHGVSLRGGVLRGRGPATAAPLARRESPPLADLLVPMLKLSNNALAEILVKTMGREDGGAGTWEAGLAAAARSLARLGLDPSEYRLADGSGLSRRDTVSAAQLTGLLVAVRQRPWFPSFLGALPVAGDPDRLTGGTLRSRMRDGPAAGNVRAKTGTLDSVSALSGYVSSADGEPLVFSVLLNQYLGSAPKDVEDALAVALARFERRGSRAGATPSPAGRPAPRAPLLPPGSPPGDLPVGGAPELEGLECSWAKAC